MKKPYFQFISIIILAGLSIVFNSCEEDSSKWEYHGPALASFPNSNSGLFFVYDEPAQTFEIEFAVNAVSSEERTFPLVIDTLSTASEDQHFSISDAVVPANEVIGKITVTSDFNNLPAGESLVMLIHFAEEVATAYDANYALEIVKFVPFDIQNFVGDFTLTEHSYFGDFTYDVTLSKGDTDQKVLIDLFGKGMETQYGLPLGGLNSPEVTFIIDDITNYHSLMEEQQAFLNEDVPWFYSSTTGNLSTGSSSFTLGTFQIYDAEGAWDIISGIEVVKK